MLARKIVEEKEKEETKFIENSISREGCLDNAWTDRGGDVLHQ